MISATCQADKDRRTLLLHWEELPEFMKIPEVKPYWEVLNCRRSQLVLKRAFDVIMSMIMIIILLIPMLAIALAIKLDSHGPVLYRQVRITQYGRNYKINKFRTMYDSASAVDENGHQIGSAVTVANDIRITKVGRVLRKYRLDEFPQLFNVLRGEMSFVGTRPEIPKYVEKYENAWNATLLLPAGITSECSIEFRNEDKMLEGISDVDKDYVETILPRKMKINLKSLRRFSIGADLLIMLRTAVVFAEKE